MSTFSKVFAVSLGFALSAPVAEACPVCGSGAVTYFAWECTDYGWELAVVGAGSYGSCAGTPVLAWGEETDCFEVERVVGGGGEDYGQCNDASCPEAPVSGPPIHLRLSPSS
ncbi:MAG: hypothetical protein ABMB14_31740 [Myxococcota bacterium]